jgi:hypothetical protein
MRVKKCQYEPLLFLWIARAIAVLTVLLAAISSVFAQSDSQTKQRFLFADNLTLDIFNLPTGSSTFLLSPEEPHETLFEPSPIVAVRPAQPVHEHFAWKAALSQSFLFLMTEQAFRLHQQHTRDELTGPFFADWFNSVSNLHGWADGDAFHVNYVGHPMQGAITGFIQVQNDPAGRDQTISFKRTYWKSRGKAMLWAAAYSTQFELGPLSESSIGNVGLKPTYKSPHPQSYVDIVITPTLGTAWLIGEDALDRYVVPRFDHGTGKSRFLMRSMLNPCRSIANVLRFKWPWYRDSENRIPQ